MTISHRAVGGPSAELVQTSASVARWAGSMSPRLQERQAVGIQQSWNALVQADAPEWVRASLNNPGVQRFSSDGEVWLGRRTCTW